MRGITTCFIRSVGVKRSDIQHRLLQFAYKNHLQPALCSTMYGTSSVARIARWVSLLHPLVMVHWRQTKSPKDMAAMCNFWYRDMTSYQLFSTQPRNNIASISFPELHSAEFLFFVFLTSNISFRILQTVNLIIFILP